LYSIAETISVKKTRVPGLLCGIVSVILCLAILGHCWHVTDGQMDAHTMTAYTALA